MGILSDIRRKLTYHSGDLSNYATAVENQNGTPLTLTDAERALIVANLLELEAKTDELRRMLFNLEK